MWQNRPRRRNRPRAPSTGASPERALRRTVLFLTLLFLVFPCFGQGRESDVLSRADELIAQKHYNEALSILVPYAQENPADFERAQIRIRRIVRVREEYNTRVQELLKEMESETPRDPVIVEMTNYLLALDPERVAETHDIIARLREVALFKSNQRWLARILDQGQAQIRDGRYTDALRTYTEGFAIYRDEFFRSGFGQDLENRARQGVGNVEGNIAAVGSAANTLRDAVNTLENMASWGIEPRNLADYRAAYTRLGTEMDRITALRNSYAGTDTAFREDLLRLRRAHPELADRNFLAFAVRLMEGRPNDDRDGILGVFDALWNQEIPRARNILDAKARTVYLAAVNEAGAREYGSVGRRAEAMEAYAGFPADLESRWNRYDTGSGKETVFNQTVPAGEAGNYLRFRTLAQTGPYWAVLGQLGGRLNAVQERDTLALWRAGGDADELIRAEDATALALRQIRLDARALLESIGRETAETRGLGSRYPNGGFIEYIDGINAAVSALTGSVVQMEDLSAVKRYTIANGQMAGRLAAREGEFREASELFRGRPTDKPAEKGENYLARYPTRAAALFTRMDGSLEQDRQTMTALLGRYAADAPEIAQSERVRALREEAAALQTRLENTRTQGRNSGAVSAALSADARNLRQEGDRLFAEAQAALARNDFDTAENRVERAGTAYFNSLEREDDEETWNKRQVLVPNLNTAIAARLNEEVIRQVTELTEQIRDAYYGGDFDRAEQNISRARNVWKRTHPEGEHPDLAYWQSMITIGLRSGRHIPVTAPLYAEMSQLLSEARRNYEEGRRRIQASRTEGTRYFTAALQNIQKVKLVYPMNEEAGILDLRVEREMNPGAFEAAYREKYNTAMNRNSSGGANTRMEALNDLRNLRALNEGFTNWDAVIRQAEINAGLRPPDPTERDIQEAAEIAARARPVVASRNIDQIKRIQPELERAMKLNPNNREARDLFNSAARLIYAGGLVLDVESERLYQQAFQALNQNNFTRARLLINQIYARNPEYRSMPKMISIEQRARSGQG
ncbi:MAG: hypothetical protein LBD09_02070 [Treponema sp.]|jgi:hypothetical protein|nr:hypothetical protein [Treponema sp.]